MAASSAHPPKPSVLAAKDAAALPLMGLGDGGCLLAARLDPERLDFLDLLDGGPGPDLAWERDGAVLRLAWRPLGVEVAAGDPTRLMEALEFLADRADALLPRAQADVGRATPIDAPADPDALRQALALRLRRDLGVAGRGRPAGARFQAAAMVTGRAARAVDPLGHPAVEDHRAVIPPRRRS